MHRADLDWLKSGMTDAVMPGVRRAASIFIFAFIVSSLLSFHGSLTLKRCDSSFLAEKIVFKPATSNTGYFGSVIEGFFILLFLSVSVSARAGMTRCCAVQHRVSISR
jgi:hypothetical protein